MAKRGPKSKFNDKVRETILRLLKEGKTEAQIAEVLGVCTKTISNWKGKHQELLHAVNESKLMADELVEISLYRRALGYSHPEEKIIQTKDGGLDHAVVTKYYPPDTTAAMFWLRNRQPKRWKEKTEGDVNVNNTVSVKDNVSDEQLDARIDALLAKKQESK